MLYAFCEHHNKIFDSMENIILRKITHFCLKKSFIKYTRSVQVNKFFED